MITFFIVLIITIDIIFIQLNKRGILKETYQSVLISRMKQLILYGNAWNSIRITRLFDTIYINFMMFFGYTYLKKNSHNPESLALFILTLGTVIAFTFFLIKWSLNQKNSIARYISIIISLIHTSFALAGMLGCSVWMQERYGGTIEYMVLTVMIIPFTNLLYRKILILNMRRKTSLG